MQAASIGDYRELARRRLPRFLFDYIDGGSYAEVTLRRNVADLEAIALRQRVLRDMAELDLSTELFGRRMALPVALAPVGLAGMCARRGENQAARAAAAAEVPFTLSTVAVAALPEVAKASPAPIWFQLYMVRDRALVRDLLAQAAELGCDTLQFTVDLPVPGSRYRDVRSGLGGSGNGLRRIGQALARPGWTWDVAIRGRPHVLGNVVHTMGGRTALDDFLAWMRSNFDPSIGWRDLDFIRSEWKGPLVIKGLLDPEDAREAVRLGADGIVVSNHGGRQLDGVLSTARALPPIVEAVGDGLTVLADGGVRSGLDVVRLLALGAKAVLIGRPWAWALGAAGERGVAHVLALIEAEMRVAMTLCGVRSIGEIDRTVLAEVFG